MNGQQIDRVVRVKDLAGRPGVSVDGSYSLWEGAPLFHGAFWNRELRPGLHVHGSDVIEDEGFTALSSQHPGLSCVFFLEGNVEVTIGDREMRFHGDGSLRKALLIPSTRAESFRRRSLGKQRVKHLVLSVTPEWLEVDGLDYAGDPRLASSAIGDHLASRAWEVSSALSELVSRLIGERVSTSRVGELRLESAAIAIIAEAMEALAARPSESTGGTASRNHARLERAREFLLSCKAEWPSVEQISREAGLSPSSLQRLFQQTYGVSVFEYMRRTKLQIARQLLAANECTIQDAAAIAGYSNAANFSTAFKRAFGMTPREIMIRSRSN